MDVDILKPDTGYLSVIERPTYSAQNSTKHTPTSSGRHSEYSGGSSPVLNGYTEPVSEGEEDEVLPTEEEGGRYGAARDEDKRTGLSGEQLEEAIKHRTQMLKERAEEEEEDMKKRKREGKEKASVDAPVDAGNEADGQHRPSSSRSAPPALSWRSTKSTLSKKALAINPLAPSSEFDETLKTKLEKHKTSARSTSAGRRHQGLSRSSSQNYGLRNDEEAAGDGDNEDGRRPDEAEEDAALGGARRGNGADDRILDRSWRAPQGKRIAVPVRIEPKVYFAAERTFLVSVPASESLLPSRGFPCRFFCSLLP